MQIFFFVVVPPLNLVWIDLSDLSRFFDDVDW